MVTGFLLIKETFRKYFGAEVHSERIYAENRFPYLDDDFVDFIFQSPFAGVYSNALKPTPNQRFKCQYFYAKIMEEYKPELLKYQTDHGFPANYVLNKFPILKIGFPYLYNKRKKRRENYKEFRPVEWAEIFINEVPEEQYFYKEVYADKLLRDIRDLFWKENFSNVARAISLGYWMKS